MKYTKNENNIKNNLFAFGYSFLLLTLLLLFTHLLNESHPLFYGKWQHFYYLKVAENPFTYNYPPYCWRIFEPILVNILPFSFPVSFLMTTAFSILFSGFLIFLITEHLLNDIFYGLLSITLFYSFVFTVRYNLIEFIGVDALANLFLLLGIYAILKNNKSLFIFVLLLGIFTKETILFLLPFGITFDLLNTTSKKEIFQKINFWVLVIVFATIIFISLRISIQSSEEYSFLKLLKEGIYYRLQSFLGNISTFNKKFFFFKYPSLVALINIYRLTFGVWGILFLSIFFNKIPENKIKYSFLILLLTAYAQIFVAGDNERLVAVAFPSVIILSIFAIKHLINNYKISHKLIFIWAFSIYLIQPLLSGTFYSETYFSIIGQIIISIIFILIIFVKYRVVFPQKILQKRKNESDIE